MSKGKFIKGGILGAIAGVVTGILIAPKSGKKTRSDIKKVSSKAAKEAETKLKEVYSTLGKLTDKAKKEGAQLTGKAKKEFDELVNKSEIIRESAKELITNLRDGEADESKLKKTIEDSEAVKKGINKQLKNGKR